MTNVYQNSDNLDKMGKFLEKYNLPKSTQMKQKILLFLYLIKKLNILSKNLQNRKLSIQMISL